MAARKRSLMVLSVSLAFIAWGVFFPTLTNGSVHVETADFGEVVVGSSSAIPLHITNTGSSTLILYFRYENYSCNFSLPPQELVLQPGDSVKVEISWTPSEGSEGSTCSDLLYVKYGDLYETVLVTGRAVDASGPARNPNSTIVIGEYDTGVVDRLYEGKSISEWIGECAADTTNHGQFVSCVAHLTNELKKAGIISGKEKGAIQSCGASDRDCVPDAEEQGPRGNNLTYDGNDDGIADSQQDNVVSYHTYDGQHYVTMACSEPISDVAVVDKPSSADSPSGVEFPYGLFEFTINSLNPGDATTVIIYLPVGANPTTYYKYGPTPNEPTNHWYEFMYDAQTQTGAGIDANVVTLHFVDGQRGDDDLTANGTVVDLGGPGLNIATLSSSGGCFIATAAYGSPVEPHVK